MSSPSSELALLHQLLVEVELSQFATKIIEDLQVSRISHFDYVTTEDLMGIGMGKPAARRLLDSVKKRKGTLKKKIIQTFINQSATSNKESKVPEKIPEEKQLSASNFTCLIKESDLKLGAQLGDGSFGIVHKGEWKRPDGSTVTVAVKVLKEDMIQQQAVYEDFVREVEAMHSLQHHCLIRLHGVVLSHPLMMITELAPLGSLLDYLHKQCSHTSICSLWEYATQISSGMAFLESRRLLHRDLACRNVFLTSSSQAKIGDFGLLRPLPTGSDCYLMTEQRRVPFPWCAPESLKYRKFSLATDVWMFGITLWEMFTFGEEPWAGLSGHEILSKIDKKGERLIDPQAAPEIICKLMQRCWAADPANRPRFSEITVELSSSSPLIVRMVENKQEPAWDEPAGAQKLEAVDGDHIAVIDGRPDFFWWTGQNQRTFDIGIFPRCWTEPLRRRNGEDISRPLRHSFIHTGHGSSTGQSWGNPTTIDEVYLRNPMEPLDILGIKSDSSPRRPPVEIVKTKRQFSYFRLSEDIAESSSTDFSHPTRPPVSGGSDPSPVRDEGLLIDLSSDPSPVSPTPSHLIQTQPIEPLFLTSESNGSRLYENCPSTSPVAPSAGHQSNLYGGSHFYSEVPMEPISPTMAMLTPPSKPMSPIRPSPPTEEFKKKRDEAFDWLGQALGQSLTISTMQRNYSTDSHKSPSPSQNLSPRYGFEDDFSTASSVEPRKEHNGFVAHQQNDTNRQPHYPKPGNWPDPSSADASTTSPPSSTTHWEQLIANRIHSASAVQTAHVRPFMVASSSTVDGNRSSSLVAQVRLSAPWAGEQEIKQAIVISNNSVIEAVRFLQVEKLYRLGLCSKAVCLKALEATNWDLEKAASGLLDA